MASFKGEYRRRYAEDAAIVAIVGSRTKWVERTKELPAITLQIISDGRDQHMRGFHGTQATRVQADLWAKTDSAGGAPDILERLLEAVLAAVVPAATVGDIKFGRSFVDGEPRDCGEQTENGFIHRTSLDLVVWHSTA